ncbi:hypothetical protein AGLY_004474 [Aphis glycines]|uniref:Uncharacterized protein n=1 Tax=Aphis glycines TaxID=307491 RepID=A0A6G0TY60_APHGL|nr:hypothetical protein AGLY_004474 [Aphis glycines]
MFEHNIKFTINRANKSIAIVLLVTHNPTKCLESCLCTSIRLLSSRVNNAVSNAASANANSCILPDISASPSSIIALITNPAPFTTVNDGCYKIKFKNLNQLLTLLIINCFTIGNTKCKNYKDIKLTICSTHISSNDSKKLEVDKRDDLLSCSCLISLSRCIETECIKPLYSILALNLSKTSANDFLGGERHDESAYSIQNCCASTGSRIKANTDDNGLSVTTVYVWGSLSSKQTSLKQTYINFFLATFRKLMSKLKSIILLLHTCPSKSVLLQSNKQHLCYLEWDRNRIS